MSRETVLFRRNCGKRDALRDADKTIPDDLILYNNLRYSKYIRYGLLDVYRPKAEKGLLPVIVSIHGGAWVYGSKETYQYYCMSLAQYGFAVINFNYRLAPKFKFPTPLYDINSVLQWILIHKEQYGLDANNVFLVGDSAGAQLASQYATVATNPVYAALFHISPAPVKIRAQGLNCGIYDLGRMRIEERFQTPTRSDYFGHDLNDLGERLDVLKYVTQEYPPSFLLSSQGDFLLEMCSSMHDFLSSHGIHSVCKIYGDRSTKHVFHVNISTELARQANQDEIHFFRKFLR